jgi:demethylmenaquinone methyltransferase/2-methoxy-6-polyprenyl-1,4-benzoquinol methylase
MADREQGPAWTSDELGANPHAATDKADRVQRMFAAIARSYDLNNRLHSFGRDQAWRRKAVKLCQVQPTDRVLDVACGTGDLTLAFAAARPARLTGLDFTEEMLQIARQKSCQFVNGKNGVAPEYVRGDAMALPFDDGTFDVVSIAFGIRNVNDPRKALNEFRRVLRAGGRLMVLEFSRPRNAVIRVLNALYTSHVMPVTASLIARDHSGAYRYLPRSIQTFLSSQEMIAGIQGAGFATVTAHPMTFGVCTAYLGRVS